MDNELSLRPALYLYYKSLFDEFIPYYFNIFSTWAYRYCSHCTYLDITIDETDWGDNVKTIRINDDSYQIKIPKGLFERIAFLVFELSRIRKNVTTIVLSGNQESWKNPDFSMYDYTYFENAVEEVGLISPNSYLRPLLHDYKGDQALYEKEFDEKWSVPWPAQQIYNRKRAIPFFWIIDYIIFHEMSHILLKHFDYYDIAKTNNIIMEATLAIDEIYFKRHLIELHADIQSTCMLVCSLEQFQKACIGCPIDEEMKENMFSLAFFLQAFFTYWAKTRTSQKMHENMSHPHPDIRKHFLMEGVSRCFDEIYILEWVNQSRNAMVSLQNSFWQIGAMGLGDSIFNPISTVPQEQLEEWQKKTYDRINKYRDGLIEFSQYVKDFDVTLRSDYPVKEMEYLSEQIINEYKNKFK